MSTWRYFVVALAACGSNSSEHIDAPISTGDAEVDASVAIDATMTDAPAIDFSCVGNPAPMTADDPINLGGTVAELSLMGTTPQLAPLDGAAVTGCKPGQTNCESAPAQFATVTTPTTVGMPGSFAFTNVATGGQAYAAYYRITKTGDRKTFSFPSQAFGASFTSFGAVVFNSSGFALITIGLGVNQSAQKGDVGLIIVDCANRTITDGNLTFTIKQANVAVAGTTTFDVGSVNAAARGSYFVFNVPGGANGNLTATDIQVTYTGVTPSIAFPLSTLGVTAGATSQTVIRPGYM